MKSSCRQARSSRASFPASTYTWQASNIFYQPLYFEDPDLERYGHAYPFFIQPIVSSLRFTAQAIGLPYQMIIDPPCCRVYPLGLLPARRMCSEADLSDSVEHRSGRRRSRGHHRRLLPVPAFGLGDVTLVRIATSLAT